MPGSQDDAGDRAEQMRRAGLAAAVAVAREQGLPADDPRVLSSRGNLLVHLAPAPVVARVATLTAWTRSDPFVWLAREVAVASYAFQNGGPVVAPAQEAEPGPHWSRGLAVSLWTWVPPSQARPGPLPREGAPPPRPRPAQQPTRPVTPRAASQPPAAADRSPCAPNRMDGPTIRL